MLTVRAVIKDNNLIFLEGIDLPAGIENHVLVTFLDKNMTEFDDLSQQDLPKIVSPILFSFSNRKIQILRLAREGMTNKQIGENLAIGSGTVRNHLSGIYERLKVHNRTGAIAKAIEMGLLD